MPARIFECRQCKTTLLGFDDEVHKLTCKCKALDWKTLPPNPTVVQASSMVMVEYYLDSMSDLIEQAERITEEAANERELKHYTEALREQ